MTTHMQPGKVVECHTELRQRFLTSERFQNFFLYTLRHQLGDGGLVRTGRVQEETAAMAAIAYTEFGAALKAAYPYHVSADMTKLVQAAANALDETDLCDSTLAPTGCGIARFDGGIPITDIRGKTLIIDWIVWTVAGTGMIARKGVEVSRPGMVFFEFNDVYDNPDEITKAVWNEIGPSAVEKMHGRWGFHGINVVIDGDRIGGVNVDVSREFPFEAMRAKIEGWEPSPTTNTARILHAFFLMLNQTITVTSQRSPHPSVAAAAKKVRLPKAQQKVTVVELRRREVVRDPEGGGEHRAVEWSHRWLVRGFWRWQTYGPGMSQKKRLWINPYIKGPEDRPLKVTEHVYALKR